MKRIGELDLPDRLAPTVPRWLTVAATGIGCAAAVFFLRAAIDLAVPNAAPFALVFPAVLLATLLAHWEAGAVAGLLSLGYAWRVLLPRAVPAGDPTGVLALAVVTVSCILCIAIAEAFRVAVRTAAVERDREIADRDLHLAEFDHRVKNNFAIVASLLDMQRRRARDPATGDALTVALNRVQSIARAHRHLYRGGGGRPGMVEISDYLTDLCATLSDALLLRGAITLSCTSDAELMKRDRAVSIGLVANELVTNAAKHAFRGRDAGHVTVSYVVQPGRSILTVADDGVGVSASVGDGKRDGGLGTRLIDGFARQADGTLVTESGEWGTRVRLELDG